MSAATATAEPAWLAERRRAATARVGGLPLPTAKTAGWEFTPLDGLELEAYAPVTAAEVLEPGRERPDVPGVFRDLEEAVALTQVDGVADVAAAERLGEGQGGEAPIVAPLDVAAARWPELVQEHLGTVVHGEDDPFAARNEAGWSGGAFVYVPRGVRLEAPVLLTAVHAAARTTLPWRTLVVVEDGAEAEVYEQWVSGAEDTDAVFNAVTELVVGQNARLRYVAGQDLADTAWVFGTQRAEVGRDGHLDWVALGFGSAKGKVRMETKLAGRGAEGRVTGAYAGTGRQHLDFDTTQEHAAEDTISDLAFRGLLDGRSTAVWRGMIRVDPGAQRTDAFQDARNLILSKRAHADAIPGLEIEANDVRCTHAAAVAQIDRDQLFYLRSRGLRDETAKRLIVEGFLQALVERFPEGRVGEQVGAALERRLEEVLG